MFKPYLLFSFVLLVSSLKNELDCLDDPLDISDGNRTDVGEIVKDGIIFTSDDYYFSFEQNMTFGCICNLKKCIRKCCEGTSLIPDSPECRAQEKEIELKIYNELTLNNVASMKDFYIIQNAPNCERFSMKSIPKVMDDDFLLQEDGSVLSKSKNKHYNYSQYCIEYSGDNLSIYTCEYVQGEEQTSTEKDNEVNGIGLSVSVPFLFITFLVYFIISQKKIHERALSFHVLSVLLGSVVQLSFLYAETPVPWVPCTILAYLFIYFTFAAFFWLNVICIDMWLSFRNSRRFFGMTSYRIFAWGSPLLLVFVVFLINEFADHKASYYPHIGEQCDVRGDPLMYYRYLPLSIIVTVNVILFILISRKIFKVRRETNILRRQDSQIHTCDQQRFYLYLKLFLAMGLNWTMEIISFFVEWHYPQSSEYFFKFTDYVNALYGVVIFFLFVFKMKTWKSLKKRYYTFFGKRYATPLTTNRLTRATTKSTRNGSKSSNSAISSTKQDEI